MRALLVLIVALALGCDKDAATPPMTASQTAEQTAEAVEELVNKLPEAPPREAAPVDVQIHGKFGTNGALPTPDGDKLVEVDPKAVAELNLVAQFRIESAFAERAIDPNESVLVQLGGKEADGLLVNARYQGKTASHHVVPASSGPELVSNLDHTMDRVLGALEEVRQRLAGRGQQHQEVDLLAAHRRPGPDETALAMAYKPHRRPVDLGLLGQERGAGLGIASEILPRRSRDIAPRAADPAVVVAQGRDAVARQMVGDVSLRLRHRSRLGQARSRHNR